MHIGSETGDCGADTASSPDMERLARRHEAELFYGVVPEHVWDGLRYGDALGRDIAAAAGLVRWRRQALRRAIAALRGVRRGTLPCRIPQDVESLIKRLEATFVEARRRYRDAQRDHRTLLDERWRRRVAAFRAAAE
jgi:hypothetical protein